MILIPYILSLVLGALIAERLLRSTKITSWEFKISLSLPLGLGLSGIIVFLSLLIYGQFSAILLIIIHLALISVLFILDFKEIQKIPAVLLNHLKQKKIFDYAAWTILAGLTFCIYLLATQYPFGGWDAWALWNMKLKFIMNAGTQWKNIFTSLHWHTQPDYPLLLSCVNAWLSSTIKNNTTTAPFITAVILSASTGYLLFCGLKLFIKKYIALTVAVLLMSNSYYILLSTSQYSDILLSLFVLSAIITLSIYIKYKNANLCFLMGLFAGLMTFTKNEGIVLSLILVFLTGIYLIIGQLRDKNKIIEISFTAIGYGLIAAITASYKIFITPKNPDIIPFSSEATYTFFNLNGFLLIVKYFVVQLIHPKWSYIWILILATFFLFIPKYFKKNNIIFTLFFLLYAGVIVLIYLTTINFDLSWRLNFTLKRIMFYLLPSLLFFNFKTLFAPDENKT